MWSQTQTAISILTLTQTSQPKDLILPMLFQVVFCWIYWSVVGRFSKERKKSDLSGLSFSYFFLSPLFLLRTPFCLSFLHIGSSVFSSSFSPYLSLSVRCDVLVVFLCFGIRLDICMYVCMYVSFCMSCIVVFTCVWLWPLGCCTYVHSMDRLSVPTSHAAAVTRSQYVLSRWASHHHLLLERER